LKKRGEKSSIPLTHDQGATRRTDFAETRNASAL